MIFANDIYQLTNKYNHAKLVFYVVSKQLSSSNVTIFNNVTYGTIVVCIFAQDRMNLSNAKNKFYFKYLFRLLKNSGVLVI